MTKLTLTNVANLQNESSAITTMATNNAATVTAMENTLSRDGALPNHMNADLDMNSNRIINLPDAVSAQEPATFSQLEEYVGSVGSGAVLQAEYVTLSNNVILQNERALTAGNHINLVDGGAGSTVTIDVNETTLNADTATLTNKTVNLADNTLTGTTAQFNTALSDNDFATLAGTETLTNKTLNLANNTVTGTRAQFNTALSDDDFSTLTGTETLTNKTVNLSNNTLTGTRAQFNTAMSDDDFVSLTGTETLTNKTLTLPTVGGGGANFAGSTSGTTNVKATAIAGATTLTLPAATDTLVGKATTDTLTNKTYDTAGTGNSFSINGVAATANTGTGAVVRATSPTLVTPTLGAASGTSLNLSGLTASNAVHTDGSKNLVSVANTGTGNNVLATSPALTTPNLGTPSAATLTNATGLPVATGISGLGTGVATFLATPSSANLRGALTDEVGTGAAYFVGGALGTPASATLTNATGLPLTGLNTQAAYTLVGNNTGSAASPTAVDIATVTSKASPAATDLLLISDQAASGAWKRATVSSIASAGSVSSIAGNTGAFTLDRGVTNSTNAIRIDVPVFYGFLGGLTITTSAGSAQFTVSQGGATDSTAVDFLKLTSTITKTTSAWAVGTSNGSLDTGTIAADTWYYVYVIKRLDTGVVDVLTSLSATSPTLPTNYTLFRRIGAMRTETGVIWRNMVQYGDDFYFVTPIQSVNVSGTIGASRTLLTLHSPPSMVSLFRAYFFNAGAAATLLIQPPFETDRATGAYMSLTAEVANQGSAGHFEVMTNSSTQIAVRAGAASGSMTIETFGWRDTRGK